MEVKLITVGGFADMVRVSRNTIYTWVREGMPHYVTQDSRILIDVEKALVWMHVNGRPAR